MSYLIQTGISTGIHTEFFGLDAESTRAINIKEFGSKWIWYDRKIFYKFNKHGYRMNKELDDVDFDNYIAFFGCSNTVGVGLPLEETFAYQIADKCGMDYVNAAAAGGSCDFVVKNFVSMIEAAPAPPKIVVINWPEISRTIYWYKNSMIFFYPAMAIDGPGHRYWNDAFKRFISEDSNLKNHFAHIRKTVVAICKLANIKLFECSNSIYPQVSPIGWPSEQQPTNKYSKNTTSGLMMPTAEYINWINKHFARDILVTGTKSSYLDSMSVNNSAHPGIEYQKQVVDLFFSKIQS